MRISNRSRYGLRAIVYLANNKKICSIKEISEKENIPFGFLEKIVSKLEKGNLVKAQRGSRGGYYLACSPKEISIEKILKTLEDTMFSIPCKKDCSYQRRRKKCPVKNVWEKIQDALNSTLSSITLADLINDKHNKEK